MKKPYAKKKTVMLEALRNALGVVSIACKVAGIERTTHYLWLNKDPQYAKAVADIADIALDFAESSLHKQIKDGDTAATIFYLKTKGKKRGYIERNEQEIIFKEKLPEWLGGIE